MKTVCNGIPFTIEDLVRQGSNPVPLDQQASANNKYAHFSGALILFQPLCSTVCSLRPAMVAR